MEAIKKVAVVTGASQPRGIGRAIALTLAKEGIDVAVTGFVHMEGAQLVANEVKKLGRKSVAVRNRFHREEKTKYTFTKRI